jgi:hypothetical protein
MAARCPDANTANDGGISENMGVAMSLALSKRNFVEILSDPENKVIALTGKWGTGKSFLWNELYRSSADAYVRDAIKVSLFGVTSIGELKLRLAQGVIPKLQDNNALAENVRRALKGLRIVLRQVSNRFDALDDLALLIAPSIIKGRFIVIDDIERKHEKLSIDEILGFIDDCVQNLKCRILLILNDDKLKDRALWEQFREKVIDQELRLDTTPDEAFDIAVGMAATPYAATIKKAVSACRLTNIRVIQKVIRVVNRLLSRRIDLSQSVLERTVPSTTLLSAIYYKGIDEGPTMEFVLDFNNNIVAMMAAYQKKKRGEQPTEEDKRHDRWRLLLDGLGIKSTDEFESIVADCLRSGMVDTTAVTQIVDRYRRKRPIWHFESASRHSSNAAAGIRRFPTQNY